MQVEYIKLQNFRSYKSARVEFGGGIIAILGENWVGKSSLLLALGFVVFNHRIGKAAEYLREGTEEGRVQVGLILPPDDQHYQIRRHFNAKTTIRYQVRGPDGICASGVREVQAWLRDKLGVSPDLSLSVLFESTIGVPQGTLTAPFLLSPGSRKEFFEPLLRVRDWQKASKELQPAARVLTTQIQELTAEADKAKGQLMILPALRGELDTVDATIDLLGMEVPRLQDAATTHGQARDRMVALQHAVAFTAAAAKEARIRVDAHRSSVEEWEAAVQQAELAATIVRTHTSAYNEYQAAEKGLRGLEATREEHDKLLARQARLRTEVVLAKDNWARGEELGKEHQQTRNRVVALRGGLHLRAEHMASLAALERPISNQRSQLTACSGRVAVLQAASNELDKQSRFLQEEGGPCPTCGTSLTLENRQTILQDNTSRQGSLSRRRVIHQEQAAGYQREISRLDTLYQETQDAMSRLPQQGQLDQAIALLRKQAEALGILEEKAVEGTASALALEKTDHTLSTEFGNLGAMLSRFQAQRDTCEAGYQLHMINSPRAARLPSYQYKLRVVQATHLKLEAEALRLRNDAATVQEAYDPKKHTRIEAELTTLRKAVAASEAKLQGKEERRDAIRSQLTVLKAVQAARNVTVSKLKENEQTHETLQWIRGLLREAGPLITRRLVRQISQGASEIYQELTGDPSRSLRWSQDYGLVLNIEGHERNFASQLSGGEQICAALALRLSLLKETSTIDLVLFDEPTMFLDPQRCNNLAEAVARIQGFSQVIVISHKDVFEHTVESFVRIVKDETGSHPAA